MHIADKYCIEDIVKHCLQWMQDNFTVPCLGNRKNLFLDSFWFEVVLRLVFFTTCSPYRCPMSILADFCEDLRVEDECVDLPTETYRSNVRL